MRYELGDEEFEERQTILRELREEETAEVPPMGNLTVIPYVTSEAEVVRALSAFWAHFPHVYPEFEGVMLGEIQHH